MNSTGPCCKQRLSAVLGNRCFRLRPSEFFAGVCAAMLMFSSQSALAQPKGPDAVDIMKAHYYDYFRDLPSSRKCTPDDMKGAWQEISSLEGPGSMESVDRAKAGKKYIAFGEYNIFALRRSTEPLSAASVNATAKISGLQYIATSAGMLYTYSNNELKTSMLCFISTDKARDYPTPGLLMLAVPIQKDTPLTMTFFAPLEK
jgi:hypothetical protein